DRRLLRQRRLPRGRRRVRRPAQAALERLVSGQVGLIDTHHHFWRTALQEQPWRDPAHTELAADFEPDDLAPLMAQAGVESTVLVESVDTAAENDRLAAYAAAFRPVAGVVGRLPLDDPAAARADLARAHRAPCCCARMLVPPRAPQRLHP